MVEDKVEFGACGHVTLFTDLGEAFDGVHSVSGFGEMKGGFINDGKDD